MKQSLLKLAFTAVMLVLIVPFTAVAQTRNLTGTVVDEQGIPVAGATVFVDGTSKGTVTGGDGTFILNGVTSNQSITVSSLGFETRIVPVGNSSTLQVTLAQDAQRLDDVIVIGYGVQKKSDVTGAIASIKGEVFANRSVENVQQALQGKAAGVQVFSGSSAPGSSPAVRIRGFNSYDTGASEPLYVVDGLKVKDIAYLDPNVIQSMEVLKDGASAAIYGAQAGNGVVLITTKNGGSQQGRIFYDFNYGITSLARKANMMNARQYVDYYTAAGQTNYKDGWDGVTDTDWQDVLYGDKGSFQRHTVGFEAGNEKGKLYSALSYMHNDGMYYGDKDYMKRLSFQVNASYNIKPWLEFTTNNTLESLRYSRMDDGNGSPQFASPYFNDPLTPPFYPKDNLPDYMIALIKDRGDHMFMKNENGDYVGVPQFGSASTNPLTRFYSQDSKHKDFNFRGASAINFKPLKGLVYTSRVGYRLSSEDYHYLGVPVYFAISPRQKLTYEAETVTDRFYEWENFINYQRTFGKHSISAMVGMSYAYQWRNFTRGSTDTFKNDADNFHDLDFSDDSANRGVGGRVTENANISYFGRLGYSYDDRYYIQVNFRSDAFDSSRLSKDSRWGHFPSVSAGWTISNEAFMENVSPKAVSFLKVRGSWGINGNINVLSNYPYTSYLEYSKSYPVNGSLINTLSPATVLANPGLKWEESQQVDIGIDARFLNDRLSFTMDFYNKITKGMLIKMDSPLSSGTEKVTRNVGRVLNRGFEFEIGWQDKAGEFTYGINANMSTIYNRVKSMGGARRIDNGFVSFDEGQQVWSFYGYDCIGIDPDTGNAIYRDVVPDGTINGQDKVFLGSAIPKFTYGITLNAAYKGLDLLVFGAGSHGGKLAFSPTASLPEEFWTESWNVKGAGAKYPKATVTDQFLPTSSLALQSGSYFKIKQIQLGYTIPAKFTRKIAVERLRVFVSLDNFFTISKYYGMDPEAFSAAPPKNKGNVNVYGSMGVDDGIYPTPKTVTFGLNLSF